MNRVRQIFDFVFQLCKLVVLLFNQFYRFKSITNIELVVLLWFAFGFCIKFFQLLVIPFFAFLLESRFFGAAFSGFICSSLSDTS